MLEYTAGFLSALKQAQDIDAIWSSLSSLAANYGLDRVLLGATRLDAEQGALIPVDYRTDLPKEEFQDYLQTGRYRLDPMFLAAQMIDKPFCAHLDQYRHEPMTASMQDLFESSLVQARPFRMAMPVVTAPEGLRWSVVFGGEHTVKEASNLTDEATSVLWLAASAASLRLLDLAQPRSSIDNPLSVRERECLLRLAQGLRVDRIAERVGVSIATVDMHLANVRRKLKARTSAEAVARAMQAGFISP